MKRIIGAVCLFAVILFGTIAPRPASAHAELTAAERAGTAPVHPPNPKAPVIQIALDSDNPQNAIRITWEPGHAHRVDEWDDSATAFLNNFGEPRNPNVTPFIWYYWQIGRNPELLDKRLRNTIEAQELCDYYGEYGCEFDRANWRPRPGETIFNVGWNSLSPGTTYYVRVATMIDDSSLFVDGEGYITQEVGVDTATITTVPEPETPNPPVSNCSFEHRLTSVPATTGGGYTSQILISSKDSNATATIRAYQSDNGNQIDVLDSEGNAVTGSVSFLIALRRERIRSNARKRASILPFDGELRETPGFV